MAWHPSLRFDEKRPGHGRVAGARPSSGGGPGCVGCGGLRGWTVGSEKSDTAKVRHVQSEALDELLVEV